MFFRKLPRISREAQKQTGQQVAAQQQPAHITSPLLCRRVTVNPTQSALTCILSWMTYSGDLDSDALRAA